MFLKYKKPILIIVLSAVVLSNFYFRSPNIAKALDGGGSWAQFIQYQLKEFGLDTIARLVASRLLSRYLNGIVDQINNSGRTGRSPAFVTNWRRFLTDAQNRGEQAFRAVLGNTVLCPHNNDIRTIFNAPAAPTQIVNQGTRVGNLDPFTRRAGCSMPRGWTLQAFEQSFDSNGGWEALTRLAEPQNNFFGTLLMSMGELAAQRAIDVAADSNEVRSGSGFTGTRARCSGSGRQFGVCLNGQCAGGRWDGQLCSDNSDCAVPNTQASCTFLGEVLSPGDLLGKSASQTIDKKIGWLITSDEISEVILSLLQGLLDKLINFRGRDSGDSNVSDPNDQYRQCTNQCRGRSGDAYRVCMQDCGIRHGNIDTPSDYNFNNPPGGGGGTPTPTPTPGSPTPTPRPPYSPPGGAVWYGITLQADNGNYMVAENGGGGAINANRGSTGAWETFILLDYYGGNLQTGDLVHIHTDGGYWFRAEGGGGSTLDATDLDSPGAWESFIITRNGDQVSFEIGGSFIQAELGGGGAVNAAGAAPGPWETFTMNIVSNNPSFPTPPQPSPTPNPGPVCGNGTCDTGEDSNTCPQDCEVFLP